MRKLLIIIFAALAGAVIFAWAGWFAWNNLRGIAPHIRQPAGDIAGEIREGTNRTDFPLNVEAGFEISVFAEQLPGARVMEFDSLGNMWVSLTGEGKVMLLTVEDGKVTGQAAIFQNLNKPHGLAFYPENPFMLYIAEADKISRVPVYSEGGLEKIIDLPAGGNHFTRTIAFGPDGRLYISVGSTCNVCREQDARRAAIYSIDKDGGDFRLFATGLRNAVFFDWHVGTGEMWATEMGRDLLGDDTPPDEINIVEENGFYGWPICYGKNIHDTNFEKNTYIRNPCDEEFGEIPSYIDIPAHSAPLGLAFIPAATAWPEEYWHDLLVAYHGSWNRTEPTGYKIVRFSLDEHGNTEENGMPQGKDFIAGWLTQDNRALGRPVDILVQPDGAIYISDDKAGVVYRVLYTREGEGVL